MKKFKLKYGNFTLSNENNAFSAEIKEIRKAWNWSIDQVWGKFHEKKSEALRHILNDYYVTIVEYIMGQTGLDEFSDEYESCDVLNAGTGIVYELITKFKKGGDKEFKKQNTSKICEAMFKAVRSKDIKKRLGNKGEKIDFGKLKFLPSGRPKKRRFHNYIIKM